MSTSIGFFLINKILPRDLIDAVTYGNDNNKKILVDRNDDQDHEVLLVDDVDLNKKTLILDSFRRRYSGA